MSDAMQGMIIFADDVRDENGGKSSVMGILGSETNVYGAKILRQLAVVFMAWAPDGELELMGDIEIENAPEDYPQPGPLRSSIPGDRGEGLSLVQIVARLQPMELDNGPVRVHAKFSLSGQAFENSLLIKHCVSDEDSQ
jgi:hypothetical protein